MICFTDFWQKGPKLTKGVRRPRSEKSSGLLISKSPLRRGREDQISLKMKKDIEDNPQLLKEKDMLMKPLITKENGALFT